MKIIEKIKTAVEHTSDSWQQKLLDDYNKIDNPGARARKIIGELVAPLQRPNQVIINDIVSLIYALASNPDPSVDIEQVVTTAELLINELVEPIPNPDKRLMDELLHIIVASAQHNHAKPAAAPAVPPAAAPATIAQAPQVTAGSAPAQSPQSAPPAPVPAAQAQQPTPAPAPKASSAGVDTPMIKLIMDEMKDIIKKGQLTEQRVSEVETRLTARISGTSEDIQAIKDKLKKQEADLDIITKNMDKFISLYEIVINQYNPFIEHVDEHREAPRPAEPPRQAYAPAAQSSPPPQPIPQTPVQAASPPAPSQTAQAGTAYANNHDFIAPKTNNDLSIIIDEVKAMSEPEYGSNKEKIAAWIETIFGDANLATSVRATQTTKDAVKLLLKKSLQSHMRQ